MSGQIGHFRFSDAAGSEQARAGSFDDTADEPGGGRSSGGKLTTGSMYGRKSKTSIARRIAAPTAALVSLSVLVTFLLSFGTYYSSTQRGQSVADACKELTGWRRDRCIHETEGDLASTTNLHWNAWGSWFSWPAMVLFLIVAAVVGFKAVFSKSKKVVLSRQIKLALILADLLFLVSVFHIPHDNAGRAWGLWLSLVCVIGINIGILLATTEFGEWIAEHWPKRAKQPHTATEPTQQPYTPHQADYRPTPQAMPPGHRQPSWPPQAGQQQFPQPFPPGQQQVPPSDQR